MKTLLNIGLTLVALVCLSTAAIAQDTIDPLSSQGPRIVTDSVSNIGANTVTGPRIYVGDAGNQGKDLVVSARRVGAATNGLNVLLDYSPDGTSWLQDATVVLDSVGIVDGSSNDQLVYAAVAADSHVRGSEFVRLRITGLTGTNDTTDVHYHVKVQ